MIGRPLLVIFQRFYERNPGVATALAVLAGCGIARTHTVAAVQAVLWLVLLATTLVSLRLDRRSRPVLLTLVLLVVLAFVRWTHADRDYRTNCILRTFYPRLTEPDPDPVRVTGRLVGFPKRFTTAWELQVQTESVIWRRRTLACTGRVRVLVPDQNDTRAVDRYAQPAPSRTVRPDWAPGTRVEILGYWQPILTFRNPGTDDRPRVYRVNRVHGRLRVRHPALVRILDAAPYTPTMLIDRYRTWLRSRIERLTQENDAGGYARALLLALWLGDRYELPNDLHQAMARAGLLHLLAISGLHLGLLAALVWLLVYYVLGLPRSAAYLALIGVVLFYMVAVGHPPSVVRAGVLILLYAMARLFFLPVRPLNLLGALFTVLIVWHPWMLLDLGFQLTFFITAGLFYFLPHFIQPQKPSLPKRIFAYAMVSLIAWMVALPWSAGRFGYLSLGAPLFNLLVWPFIALVIAAGLFFPLLATIPFFFPFLVWIFQVFGRSLKHLTTLFLRLPTGYPVATGASHFLLCFASLVLLAMAIPRLRSLPKRVGLLALTLFVTLWLVTFLPVSRQRGPRLVMLDVAQGESIVLVDDGHAILVDGGGILGTRWDIGRWVVVPALQRLGIRAVDALVMSHPHPDHYSGLRAVIEIFRPQALFYPRGTWIPRYLKASPVLDRIKLRPLAEGDVWKWRRWHFQVLNPPQGFVQTPGTLNDGSLVLMAQTQGLRVLLTGDIETRSESRLARDYGERLHSDVLKLAHHGSRSSTTVPFFRAVHPRWALYSAGRHNRYGVPHPEVLQRLRAGHVRVLGTRTQGQIQVYIRRDGNLEVWTYHRPVWRVWPGFSRIQPGPATDGSRRAPLLPASDGSGGGTSSKRVSG